MLVSDTEQELKSTAAFECGCDGGGVFVCVSVRAGFVGVWQDSYWWGFHMVVVMVWAFLVVY